MSRLACILATLAWLGSGLAQAQNQTPTQVPAPARVAAWKIIGDAVPAPLTDTPGDPARGRAIVASRQLGLCLLCHGGPFPEERFQGNLASDLAGAGSRWSTAQLRLRIVDARAINPDTIMPSFHRTEGLHRVAPALADLPLLAPQQVEDVVMFLATLR